MTEERPTKQSDACLLLQTLDGTLSFPQKAVVLCGDGSCPARSDHVGQLPCRRIK
jgi:hypothetical protein